MIACFRPSPFARFVHRGVAVGGALLVLLLATLAASPELHERLHAADHSGRDDGCAVVLFASGVALVAGHVAVPLPSSAWHEQPRVAIAELFVATPRYLRQPERGPPVS